MYILWIFSGLTLFFGLIFLYLKYKHPQTIWLGIALSGFIFNFFLIIGVRLVQLDIQRPLIILALLFALGIFSVPILMLATFLINGIKIIQNEGFKFKNTLSLILGIGLIGYLFIWPVLTDVQESHILNTIYQFIGFSAFYLSLILFFYTLSNTLNLFHFKKHDVDYFIVLGAGLDGDKVTPILGGRIQRALDVQEAQDSGKIIFSGGQGADELIPEGEAMLQYALKEGVNSDIVFKEVESTNTYENIKFSKRIIDDNWNEDEEPKIAIVTNNYHLLRGLMQARNLGLNCIGYGSKSKFYYSLNAFLREFVAYLQMTYKVHSFVIGFAGVLVFGLYVLAELIL